jgi:nitrogenase molybdenum-iron protein alpha/beta subunit
MSKQLICKIGYYSVYSEQTSKGLTYIADSGKIIYLTRFKKYIINTNRDLKEFKTLEKLKEYVQGKLKKKTKEKNKKLSKLPKSLYLVLIKEESTGKTFVKVGITSKRFIVRRFSKIYGYEGYIVETILRRIDTPNAEKLESEIKDKLNKKRSVKKYRPILESFSGYSECFDYDGLDEIIDIFDSISKNG